MTTHQERSSRLHISDLATFTQSRGLIGVNQSWERVVLLAEQALSGFEDSEEEDLPALSKPDLDLLASARILDAASGPESRIDQEQRAFLSINSALAFAMGGNFPSATAKIQQLILAFDTPEDSKERLAEYSSACAIIAPNLIPQLMAFFTPRIRDLDLRLIQDLQHFLNRGSDDAFNAVETSWERVLTGSTENPHLTSVLYGCRTVILQIRRLNTKRVFDAFAEPLPNGYIDNLVRQSRSLLLPPQLDVVQNPAFRLQNQNFLITTPTNTGKTLLGQTALAFAFGDQAGVGVYIAPYHALAQQIYRDCRSKFPSDVKIYRAIGGYAMDLPPVVESDQSIIVCTPERLDSLLRRRPEIVHHLKCVISDESHLLEQNQRGGLIEGILTRLKMHQLQGEKFTIGLLSAVISDTENIQSWLDIPDELWIRNDWRPTARRLAMWVGQGELQYFASSDPIHRHLGPINEPLATQNLPWPEPISSSNLFGNIRTRRPLAARNISYLLKYLMNRADGPILCICMSRPSTRVLAHLLTRELEEKPIGEITARLISMISDRWPELQVLANALRKRIAYHNAGLPNRVKDLIVEALNHGELDVVSATTTLAEGVDLPFRFTVVYEWVMGAGYDNPEDMPPLLFRNISGRSGRAGRHTEGDTIIFANPLGIDDGVSHLAISNYIRDTFIDPKDLQVKSSFSDWDTESKSEQNHAVLSSQYQAALAEFPGRDDLITAFYSNLFAAFSDESTNLKTRLNAIESELESTESDLAIAQRGSPLQLTEFGRSSVLTGLSAQGCRSVVRFIDELGTQFNHPSPKFLAELLTKLAFIPELGSTVIRQMLRPRNRFVVKVSDGEAIIEKWLAGREPTNIFISVVSSRKSTVSPKLEQWISGWNEPSEWDNRLDSFSRYLNDIVAYRLPWICRSISTLAPFSKIEWIKSESWSTVAEMLEQGVDTQWALTALKDETCPARTVVGPAGRAAEALGYSMEQGRLIPADVLVPKWVDKLGDSLKTGSFGDINDALISNLTDWLTLR